jgi:hypothetical protein
MNVSPENERIRDVFAHYGLAMYLAQNLERGLSMVLALSGETSHITAWDYDARLAENYQSTFGELVSKFLALPLAASSGLIQRLEQARDHRNDLAHQYFWDHAIEFASPEGQEAMLTRLRQLQSEFESLDDALTKIVDVHIKSRGDDLESFHSFSEMRLNAFLSGAEIPHTPERVPNPVEVVAAREWHSDQSKPGNLVLISKEGRYLVPGEKGISYGPQSPPAGTMEKELSFENAFPVKVNPRPKVTMPRNYGIPLANGYVLRAKTKPSLAPGSFHVWIQKPRNVK